MAHHINPEINGLLTNLLDALCEHERQTGRRSTFILVPHTKEEEILVAQDGRPMDLDPDDALQIAFATRNT